MRQPLHWSSLFLLKILKANGGIIYSVIIVFIFHFPLLGDVLLFLIVYFTLILYNFDINLLILLNLLVQIYT